MEGARTQLTGSAINQMETMVQFQINTLIIEGLIPDYMTINNSGVKAERIPYYPGSGNKTSKYIDGLMRYAKQRFGASDKESKSIAFAIASKHKKEGMPTKARWRTLPQALCLQCVWPGLRTDQSAC